MFSLWLSVVFFPYCVLAANILYVDPVVSPSHHLWNEVVVGGLLQNGHNVTLIGHFDTKIQSPNYTVLRINYTIDFDELDVEGFVNGKKSPIESLEMYWEYATFFVDQGYKSDALKTLLLDYPRNTFDLVIYDVGSAYLYPLIEYFGNPPAVAVSPFSLPPYILSMMGAEFYSYYPMYVTPYSDQMNFWQKLMNYGLCIADHVLEYRSNLLVEQKAKERFGPNIMSLAQVQKKFNVLLANYDPILDLPQPLPPHIIPVGGLQVKRLTELTEDLQKILDDSKDGVIFLSFGTNVQWSWLPDQAKKTFLTVFSKVKQTVLWKHDQEDLVDIPNNIVIRKWFPQNSILEHKNIKLFITHCGQLSSHEAIYHGVPVLAIPFFIDQRNNAAKMEAKMLGKQLRLPDVTEDVLTKIITEIIDNSVYSERMRKYSEAYRSRKETPLETAVFWIELVLKQKDLRYLWPRARDMNFWERQNLDIFLFVSFLLTLILFVFFKLVKWIIIKIFSGKSQEKIKLS